MKAANWIFRRSRRGSNWEKRPVDPKLVQGFEMFSFTRVFFYTFRVIV